MNADLALSISLRKPAALPEQLFAALLTRGPDPDGSGFQEMAAPGYARQLVILSPYKLGRFAVHHKVGFQFTGAVATHVGFFDLFEEGNLLWFGGLRGSRYSEVPASRIEFAAYQLTAACPIGSGHHAVAGVVSALEG